MARKTDSEKKRRTTVPVVSRTAKEHTSSARRAVQPQAAKMTIVGVGIIISIVVIVLLTIAVPLRNYYHGRSEIARLNESIAAKQAEKDYLLTEIDRYRSDEYVEQEARRRFGVVAQGETAYRIMDPQMTPGHTVTTDRGAERDDRSWYEVLWDSVAEPPKDAEKLNSDVDPGQLPTEDNVAPAEESDVPDTGVGAAVNESANTAG
ncbi:MAG: septum formation initiator family protein [Corynebacterium flavescens]|uniref:septum formation initiator family protein n=1 Tax=Corynebacterium flavescens TaxID=28028 RepID=UPI003F8FD54D